MSRVQTQEASAFIQRVVGLPKGSGVVLDPVSPRLSNPYVGLVDVFDAPSDVRTTRARVVKDEHDLSAKYVMPLSETNRRKEGTPSMAADIDEFKKTGANVVAAGGAVLACLTPLSEASKVSKRAIRKYYHSVAYPTSDVDLFLLRDSVPWDVTCVRTKHTVSIHSQYPYRSVQIVLRLYSSPAEILAGFDIDAPCCAYDGDRVYANPRAIVAMMRQCNTVDMTRRSPSYEVRLAKYSARAFEVYVPTLAREDIDPTIYERSIVRITGLARLLALEKLTNTDVRFAFLESRRTLRGRPNPLNRYNRRNKRKFKGDLKAEAASVGGLEMNDYDVASLHIPYGPGWDARRIDKLVYQTDLGMNCAFFKSYLNPKNKGRRLHRHPAFFGTIQECLDDCCEHCPVPVDEDERKLQAEEDEGYIRGRIAFVQDDPGRQTLSGSFNPIDVGEWSAQVYIGPTERFFAAIAAHDRAGVVRMLADGTDVNRRDHVGRAPLHVAILCGAVDVACDLIDAGARMTARLVDGRAALHLAAQQDLLVVVRKLLTRSAINAEQAGKTDDAMDTDDDAPPKVPVESDRPSSEDDWSSEDDDMRDPDDEDGDSEGNDDNGKPAMRGPEKAQSEAPSNVGDLPEDEADLPDIIEINEADWDMSYSALDHAIIFASPPVVEELINAGVDVKRVAQKKGSSTAALPLTLTTIGEDNERTCKIAERLILAGASSSAADTSMMTIFHRAVAANRPNLVSTLLRMRNYSVLAAMVAHGVKLVPSEEDVARAWAGSYVQDKQFYHPVETAMASHDDVVRLLADLGAEINIGVKRALTSSSRPDDRRTLVEWAAYAVQQIDKQISGLEVKVDDPPSVSLLGWKGYLAEHFRSLKERNRDVLAKAGPTWQDQRREKFREIREYFVDTEKFLLERGAKPWSEVYPDNVSTASDPALNQFGRVGGRRLGGGGDDGYKANYNRMTSSYNHEAVPEFLDARYDELFEACFSGENDKIQELCLPAAVKKNATPLQIIVQAADPDALRYGRTGVTPLTAAIAGRHWDTARLVMTIAAAQYKPAAKDGKFSTTDISLDDSDNESDESDDSDGTVDAINFVDIAKRPSTVECNVHPKLLLRESLDPFNKILKDDDFEAFVNVLNLYKHSPVHIDFSPNLLASIIGSDRPDMLDEFIRRTGLGIQIRAPTPNGEDDVPVVVNDKNKVYLGLTVHGKKRTDLAKKNDPNASQREEEVETTLVWKAVMSGGFKTVEYLLGDRPIAAYKYYAASNNSESAMQLRRTADLEKVLPEWIGWAVSPLGESPLTAAVVGQKLDMAKFLFTKAPRLMASCLHERVKFLGVNSLMVAVKYNCSAELVDFLLAKSISPAETDTPRGWNIFHHMCHGNHYELLEHLLKKLPRDVVEALLRQQSKAPLHLCTKHGFKKAVQLVVDFSKDTVLTRDVDGSIPLHSAARAGYAEIVNLIIAAAPAGLHMENGRAAPQHMYGTGPDLQNLNDNPPRVNIERLETELPKLRATLERLVDGGILKRGTKTVADLYAFAGFVDARLVMAKATPKIERIGNNNREWFRDVQDSAKTLANIKAALGTARAAGASWCISWTCRRPCRAA
ncbi:hypothetical protein B0H10DRAFT_2164836 [Mycena sp. CBHHK59/15]|nr:hypothetical protein B0H10DRAFT_2164836 [Mycena sp. CBHHK59/15]